MLNPGTGNRGVSLRQPRETALVAMTTTASYTETQVFALLTAIIEIGVYCEISDVVNSLKAGNCSIEQATKALATLQNYNDESEAAWLAAVPEQ